MEELLQTLAEVGQIRQTRDAGAMQLHVVVLGERAGWIFREMAEGEVVVGIDDREMTESARGRPRSNPALSLVQARDHARRQRVAVKAVRVETGVGEFPQRV